MRSTSPLADPPSGDLSIDEISRYSRHLVLPQVGPEGQRKLKAASVVVVGTGGLGSPITLYLAAAGVGRIGVVDYDVVDATNLQRQIVHGQSTLGSPKVDSATRRLADLNPHITIEPHRALLTSANALDLLARYDIIVDGTDNFPARYLLNDAAILLGKPLVYGSIFRFEGQVSVFGVKGGPCYRCLVPVPPPPHLVPGCAQAGVLGILPGTIGTFQATEVIKLILRIGDPLVGRLLLYDALDMSFEVITLHRRATCPVCGDQPTITALVDYEEFCGTPVDTESALQKIQSRESRAPDLSATEIKARLDAGESLVLLDVRDPNEQLISRLEGALHIPADQLDARRHEIPRNWPVVVFCRTGIRSARAAADLWAAGYTNIANMAGGINAWAADIDPSIPRY